MRSGKLDVMDAYNWADIGLTWEQKESLERTNPEIQFTTFAMAGIGIMMKYDAEPFWPDIRVRQALNMAINREEIARTWGGGYVEPYPQGWAFTPVLGFHTPWDDMPKELQESYTYNPEKAKQLLAEAGYPDGFETNILLTVKEDLDLFQIVQSHFAEVGVDMEIKIMDVGALQALFTSGELEQLSFKGWYSGYPGVLGSMRHFYSKDIGIANSQCIDDPEYDALLEAAAVESDWDEYKRLLTAANDYVISHHWLIPIVANVNFRAWQPWLKSYRGEGRVGTDYGRGWLFAHVWIDQELK
jgi:peptide/nickel transport system substrate-binding protein